MPAVSPELLQEREDFLADTTAFTHKTREQVMAEITGGHSMRDEWAAWEKAGPMTDARIKEFYKQTSNYIYDLSGWHLWDPSKHASDLAMVEDLKRKGVKTVLDFGGGVGFNSIPFARAGIDVTLADLDSTTLKFAQFRAEHRNVKMRFWKSDVEPAPPLPKYDAILCLDVLEHLPKQELHDVVDKLVKLKTASTIVIIHAPFGKTAVHPMHLDLTEDTQAQVARLQSELPK
jgi:2-polyprenyl-3-methyl-5-hydroxy-6-metoxy-1,4-benzoquinol methylase